MAHLLLLTTAPTVPAPPPLPALALLDHRVSTAGARAESLAQHPEAEVILVDARGDLAAARSCVRAVAAAAPQTPVLAILTEGGLAAFSADWGAADLLLDTAGPAEVSARLRLALAPRAGVDSPERPLRASGVVVDGSTYTAMVNGEPMNLTFKEFELLKHLVQHPGRVFSREQLLHEVWGYDYFGGTRTVDVHVRRLRAKLGPDREQLIGTVRNVGYRFVPREGPGT